MAGHANLSPRFSPGLSETAPAGKGYPMPSRLSPEIRAYTVLTLGRCCARLIRLELHMTAGGEATKGGQHPGVPCFHHDWAGRRTANRRSLQLLLLDGSVTPRQPRELVQGGSRFPG